MPFRKGAFGAVYRNIVLIQCVPNKGRIMGYQAANEQIRTISTGMIAFYRKRWLEWGISHETGFRLDDHLHVIEFRAADCDTDELFEAFVKTNEALERKAYGCGLQHFGIGYLAKRPDREGGLIRALVMVEPDRVQCFRIAANELSDSRSGLTITKCEVDAGDPDAQWRWLAEGVIASTAMFEDNEPHFIMLGAERPAMVRSGGTPRQRNDCPSASCEINLLAIS